MKTAEILDAINGEASTRGMAIDLSRYNSEIDELNKRQDELNKRQKERVMLWRGVVFIWSLPAAAPIIAAIAHYLTA